MSETKKQLNVQLTPIAYDILDRLARIGNGTKSTIVEKAIREYVVNHAKELEAQRLALTVLEGTPNAR